MGGKKGGPNQKAVAGMAKKAEAAAKKQAEVDRQNEAREAESWKTGSNVRKAARNDEAAAKADEAARKRREKAELLAAEESGMSGKVKSTVGATKKSGRKPKNDLSLLEDALVKGADKKVKKKKEEEKKRLLEEKKKQEEKAAAEAAQKTDPLLANTNAMIDGAVGRGANVAMMEEGLESGLDAALSNLGVGNAGKPQKNLFKEFEARMLPSVKEEYPALRLTQQKEKVFAMWKKSPENPQNQS